MGYKYVKPIYTQEEIRKWKNMIYGQSSLKVDDWASSTQDTAPVRRTSLSAKKRSTSAPRVARHAEDDWLTGEPTNKGRTYRVKGGKSRW
mmetsp:Transcript_30595/g.72169  ORF Transcript_30595/g.72169 Transcript_30595/m.72169 type:complete len:90 (+) Transcript_30595:247-516(+)|eukprot:CAMPEP_0172407828 /NCGR_PEP_ID=MMETSP1061-20121228/75535_1 /TAXON_ID=37318 /ORGANISM="Pseudo-nitzschia pungens, Strain cf. pungens" /LENGTH=89 /DNA_ID=CAMNT_0013143937 /DNA_START=208 /DNA_END=477 /DNA_ORIENTATION=+